MITFEDFLKLDLRIGKVIQAEPHPNADKLYLLKVDIGEKIVQLVAGIRLSYTIEELKDKLVVVLVNLEPKEIRGFSSEGMLLAAQGEKGVSILSPVTPVAAGSKIK
jgi:methionyl-tRNA synthetase